MTTLSHPPRFSGWLRDLLGGPLAFIASFLVMCGSVLWLPAGAAQVDNLVIPILIFPLLCTLSFIYILVDSRPARAFSVLGLMVVGHLAMLALHLWA